LPLHSFLALFRAPAPPLSPFPSTSGFFCISPAFSFQPSIRPIPQAFCHPSLGLPPALFLIHNVVIF
jgi:hypothetical protein